MGAMTHRLHRTPRALSVTPLGVRGLLTSAFTAAALALATPNTAYAAEDPDCQGLSDNLRKLRDIANSPAPSSDSSGGGGPEWMRNLPDLSLPVGICLALIVMGAITMYVNRDKSAESRALQPGTARAGAYRAEKPGERAIGAVMASLGALVLGWGLGGIAGALIAAVIAAPVIVIATKTDQDVDLLKQGYDAARAAVPAAGGPGPRRSRRVRAQHERRTR